MDSVSSLKTTRQGLLAAIITVALCACTSTAETAAPVELSTAVAYQTQSKEYPLLGRYLYAQAVAALPATVPADHVVVMDVDETVLDNSQYQRERELQGLGYSAPSWNAWVERKAATAVPGVRQFLSELVARGGKVALVTNRDKTLDNATWQNLLALGLPLTAENTCVLGRTAEDKSAVNGTTIVNDKDLRRLQLTQGEVKCSNATVDSKAIWAKPQQIIMQIGDNIEDFARHHSARCRS